MEKNPKDLLPISINESNRHYAYKDIWQTQDVVQFLEVSPSTVKRLIKDGSLKPFKFSKTGIGRNNFHANDVINLKYNRSNDED